MDDNKLLDQLLNRHCPDLTEKQKAILRASIILFSRKGYASTSTRDIANIAGVAEGTIFKHYSTKKDLLLYITELIIREMLISFISTGLDEIINKEYENIADLLTDLLKNRIDLLRKGMPVIRIIIQEIPFESDIRKIMIKKISEFPIPDKFKRIRSKGILINLSDREIITLIITCLAGYLNTRFILLPELFAENPEFDMEADIINFTQFMARGLTIQDNNKGVE